MNLLEVSQLCIGHGRPGMETRLIENIDLSLKNGEALGVVGPSGSGKTLIAFALAGLLSRPLRIVSGSIHFRGKVLEHDNPRTWWGLRGREILMLFQSPASALNSLVPVQDQIAEALEDVKGYRRAKALMQSIALLESVGLTSDKAKAYPFQLSGGMRQRVLIALALALEPAVLIADEPAVGLDPIHHAEILHLLKRLNRERRVAMIIITHDLRTASFLTHRVVVLCRGRIVESASVPELLQHPRHPYTQDMVDSLRFLEGK
ncbi:MAG: ABC transporter ATP-binding protein [Deltaproteobacteria bacterium]|nr:ABC transporter ATP-binding protein [Deltaproteobacteria bacterium]